MFSAKLRPAQLLKKLLKQINQFRHDVRFVCGSDGVRMIRMDYAHVSLIDMFLPAEMFEEYHCIDQEVIGFNAPDFIRALRLSRGTKSSVQFSLTSDKFHLKVQVEKGGK
jgi:proliferating cell nuclear antigen